MWNMQGHTGSILKHCIVEYDGVSRGVLRGSGGGAVIRGSDGMTIRMREGLGIHTNATAEYMALRRGLQIALDHGYEAVTVRGDSRLVHMHITGQWEIRRQKLRDLYNDIRNLKMYFRSCTSEYVPRQHNLAADALANLGMNLREGEIQVWYD